MFSQTKKLTHSEILGACNKELDTLVRRVERLNLPPLGPDFGSLAGSDLADALVVHRLVKNLGAAKVEPGVRRSRTIQSMLEYDTKGPRAFDYRSVPQPYRGQLLHAKAWLQKYFGKVKRSHVFRPPSGETCETAFGDVDLICKLQDPSQWRVSVEASAEAAAVCYHNHSLKRLVKQRFRELHPDAWRRYLKDWWLMGRYRKRSAFYVFHRMFLDCCTIQNVSRLSTVPKNGEKDRPISMEPFWNMVAQLSYAGDLREVLRSRLGFDLESRAGLHRTLIRHANKATIDFSNASNSNWVCVLKWLLPSQMFAKLMALRTPVCEWRGKYHPYRMLAPMGCGFTFEVMTIVLLALARTYDEGATVFGDDVIIETDHAQDFINLATYCGWKINESKSFTEGNFRESCGGFYDLATRQDILSYDFHELKDLHGAATATNKLYRLLMANQVGPTVRKHLLSCYCKLMLLLPSDTYRASDTIHVDLPDGVVIIPKLLYRESRDAGVVERAVSGYWHRPVIVKKKWTVVNEISRPRVSEVTNPCYLASYLRRGTSYDAVKRQSRVEYVSVMSGSEKPLATVSLFSFI